MIEEKTRNQIRNDALEEAAKLMDQQMLLAERAARNAKLAQFAQQHDARATQYELAAMQIRDLKESD